MVKQLELFEHQRLAVEDALSSSFKIIDMSAGLGKSVIMLEIARKLIENKQTDLILIFTEANVQYELETLFNNNGLTCNNTDCSKAKRLKLYEDIRGGKTNPVLIMSYAKPRCDEELRELVRGKNVIFLFDEIQKILGRAEEVNNIDKDNITCKSVKELLDLCKRFRSYGFTATVQSTSPEAFWRIMNYAPFANPFGSINGFRAKYSSYTKVEHLFIYKQGNKIPIEKKTYLYGDRAKNLQMREVLKPYFHIRRKTEPELSKLFPRLKHEFIYIDLDKRERALYSAVEEYGITTTTMDRPRASKGDLESKFRLLNALTTSIESARLTSDNKYKRYIQEELDKPIKVPSSREIALLRLLLKHKGEQILIFSHFIEMETKPITRLLDRAKINYIDLAGMGASKKKEKLKEEFLAGKYQVAVLSDSSGTGLNLPARVAISYDIPSTHKSMVQRLNRINRISNCPYEEQFAYTLVVRNTVDMQLKNLMLQRKRDTASILGTEEDIDITR
jgi:superfamily II DNA or RNA helicase